MCLWYDYISYMVEFGLEIVFDTALALGLLMACPWLLLCHSLCLLFHAAGEVVACMM